MPAPDTWTSADRDVVTLLGQLGDHLADRGATVTDTGFDYRAGRAELVVRAPDGTRLELTLRRLV